MFNEPLTISIHVKPFTYKVLSVGHIESNFLLFLSENNSDKHAQLCIKSIAIAGFVFSICFNSILLCFSLYLMLTNFYIGAFILGIATIFIFIDVLSFFTAESTNSYKHNFLSPEEFSYKYND